MSISKVYRRMVCCLFSCVWCVLRVRGVITSSGSYDWDTAGETRANTAI